jgi:hypothetical protein
MRECRGQASLEWIGVVLLVACALAALMAVAAPVDGRPIGAALARTIVCAVKRDCGAEHAALVRAYGEHDAGLVRSAAPGLVYEPGTLTLPVDYRRCRSHRCSDAPDDRDLDVSRAARGGAVATAFTHVVHRGRRTFVQYWLYYPDSPSTWMHSHGILKTLGIRDPAFHPDDWEGYQLRIDPDGSRWVRATAHGGYRWCKGPPAALDRVGITGGCDRWGPVNGWTRVSRGSHAGHIPRLTPGHGLHERQTSAPNLRLVPLETLDRRGYRPLPGGIDPPWTKEVFRNPAAGSS